MRDKIMIKLKSFISFDNINETCKVKVKYWRQPKWKETM